MMTVTKRELTILRSGLFAARAEIRALATTAIRMGNDSLAKRLLNIARLLTVEMGFLDRLIGRQP